MSFRNMLRPGAMFLAVGLLPVVCSQAYAQSPSVTALLSTSVTTLPSDTKNDNDPSYMDLLSDFTPGEADPLGLPAVASLSHAGSGLGAGWLVGGAIGAAAGVVGLASGHGSSAAVALRTPADSSGFVYSTGVGTTVASLGGSNNVSGSTAGNGVVVNSFGGANALSAPGGANIAARPLAVFTPEPGSFALLTGMGLMLTAVKMRRRKR